MQFSLGPLQYCWEHEQIQRFYQAVAESDIPLVYLGETVCARRRLMKTADYLAIARQLQQAGKQVVLSTLTLITAPSELTELKKIIENGHCTIEANDMAAVMLAHEAEVPFTVGPELNLYNATSLAILYQLGMQRFVMPLEQSQEWLAALLADKAMPEVEVEVTGYGYLPLAHSARCFTARQQGLTKDSCETSCRHHANGITVNTQIGQPLLRLNGIQTQSASCCDLQQFIPQMQQMGVHWYRVLPDGDNCLDYVRQLQQGAQQTKQNSEVTQRCQGYWQGQPGMASS
ncbi:U32 family peptidase [Shewanella sp. NFH-SH190041]|uniref:U32 family peptidase n=1 Tax=Shewanella sp. NFH-SH190041 TaxID=2950245 RepID=UPI0021C2D431|nr:U32 family peptidase [Shewanella sp. NFH-SH190041]BDM65476.1 U32 family peptidase [Shewanella sp. NFH-SH190041]